MADQNEWELSKENVLPLRQGRKTAHLTAAALQPHSADQTSVKQQRMAFEAELRTYDGEDPLDVWDRYIHWTEQTFPKGGLDSHLQEILQQCVAAFKDDECYKNDPRYLAIWIKFANICKTPAEIYSFMFDNKIGSELASFYDAWASELEIMGNVKKADTIYTQGIAIGAQPVELLKTKHSELQARVARRVAGELVAPPDPVAFVEDPKRTTLGTLKARGSKGRIAIDRSASTQIRHQGPSVQNQQSNVSGSTFAVFDENSAPQGFPNPSGTWAQVPTREAHKENEKTPGVWNDCRVKQKHAPAIKINEISSVIKPEFSIHTDTDIGQPAITPKTPSTFPFIQPLSAKKGAKQADPFQHVQQVKEDPNFQPMYCKHKIYNGAMEFTFEELRAARWFENQRKIEERRRQEEVERHEEALRQEKQRLEQQKQEILQHQNEVQRQKEELKLEQQRLEILHNQNQLQRQQELELERRRMQIGGLSNRIVPAMQEMKVDNSMMSMNSSSRVDPDMSGPCRRPGYSGPGLNNSSVSFSSKGSGPNSSNLTLNSQSITMNSSRGSERTTPSFSGKLTAPSPTINTKQAMSAVLGMFNDTMGNQFGWGGPGRSDEQTMDVQLGKDDDDSPPGLVMNSAPAFQIYEEADPKPTSVTPAVCQKTEDKENSVPSMKPSSKSSGLQMVFDENPMPVMASANFEMADIAEDMVVAEQNKWDIDAHMDGMENIPSEMTFAPGCSSTCNFTNFYDAARAASTPFNPTGAMAPLQSLSVSSIKPGTEKPREESDESEIKSNNSENTNSTMGDQLSRRSSVYQGKTGVKDLSPIIECSDEDVKCTTGSASPGSHYDPSNNTVAALRGRLHSGGSSTSTAGSTSGINCISGVSSISTTSIPAVGKFPSTLDHLHTQTEEDHEHDNLGDMTCHEIDITNYVPKETDHRMEMMLNMSVAIDPYDPFDEESIETFLSRLPQPLSEEPNYHSLKQNIPKVFAGETIQLGKYEYHIEKQLGSGAFANVFIVTQTGPKSKSQPEVMKVQKPGCPWEFYICKTIQERLTKLNKDIDVRSGFMSIEQGYFFINGSMMTNSLHEYGTVLDLVNHYTKSKRKIEPCLVMLIIIDLLNILEQLHQCKIIHGDFKPDNLLVTEIPIINSDPETYFVKRKPCVKLIDFGRSIDMKMYPEGTTFMAKVKTSGFLCIEMKTDQPWTYQTDLFGFIATVHVMLMAKYMNVQQLRGQWKSTTSFKRFPYAAMIWQDLIHDMLNIPSCEEMPDLSKYRLLLQEEFLKLLDVNAFNNSNRVLIGNLVKK